MNSGVIRDSRGRFIKGAKLDFPMTEKRRLACITNLGSWIGRIPPMTNKTHSQKTKEKMSLAAKTRISNMTKEDRGARFGVWKGKFGIESPRYIPDRSLLKQKQQRNDSAYQGWVRDIKERDENKCKLVNDNCSGYLIVHHIRSWTRFPELRHEFRNGITLCLHHHPLKKVDETRLIPTFDRLVGSNIK